MRHQITSKGLVKEKKRVKKALRVRVSRSNTW